MGTKTAGGGKRDFLKNVKNCHGDLFFFMTTCFKVKEHLYSQSLNIFVILLSISFHPHILKLWPINKKRNRNNFIKLCSGET